LTNGPFVRELEARAAAYLGVPQCVAVASGTAGLMLVLRAAGVTCDVVVPGFAPAATADAAAWNGLRVSLADIDERTLTLSPQDAARALGIRTSALLATHAFGTPCDVEELADLARRNGIRLFLDAAHAFGSRRRGVPVGGFGDAEVFSLSPTKTLVAGEGGIIATRDHELAERCRVGRDYGNPGDYDTRFVGLNARMSEVHAVNALASFEGLEERVARRNRLAACYRRLLGGVDGIDLPEVPEGDRSTYRHLVVLVDPDRFGLDAAGLAAGLAVEGVETRRHPPATSAVPAYRVASGWGRDLPVARMAGARALSLPLWPDLSTEQVGRVVEAVERIGAALGSRPGHGRQALPA
jgi:dTDP-4-amino-4,6-dideoxygalactose transaminase